MNYYYLSIPENKALSTPLLRLKVFDARVCVTFSGMYVFYFHRTLHPGHGRSRIWCPLQRKCETHVAHVLTFFFVGGCIHGRDGDLCWCVEVSAVQLGLHTEVTCCLLQCLPHGIPASIVQCLPVSASVSEAAPASSSFPQDSAFAVVAFYLL